MARQEASPTDLEDSELGHGRKCEKDREEMSPDGRTHRPSPTAETRARRVGFHAFSIAVLSGLCVAIYATTLHAPFVFDDEPNITENRLVRITRLDVGRLADAALHSPNLRPVAFVSFALNYYWGRYDPAGYHAVNMFIHAVNGILVYAFVLLTLGCAARQRPEWAAHAPDTARLTALLAAAMFVAHPLQTQSVTYVVQRMNCLAAMFSLAALLLYLRGRMRTGGPRWLAWGGGALCWLLALGSKEIAITLPAVVWLYEWYFFRDFDRRWFLRGLIGCGGGGLALLCAVVAWRGSGFLNFSNRDFTMWERLLTQFRVVVFYLSLVLFPQPGRLNLTHAFPVSKSFLDPPTTLLSLCLLLVLGGVAGRLARSDRVLSFFLLWFFIHLAVESSVLNLEIIFEHRLYLPLVGPAVLAACACTARLPTRWAATVGGVAVALLAVAAHARNQVWRDPLTLWTDVTAKNPGNARAQMNLGSMLEERGDFERALRHFREAVRLNPKYAEARYDLGVLLSKQGETTEAIRHFEEALRLEPRFGRARAALGVALGMGGKLDEAVARLTEAVRDDPSRASIRHDLAVALSRQGRDAEAIEQLVHAARLDPENGTARRNLAMLLSRHGRKAEAAAHLAEAVRLDPTNASLHNELGILLGDLGRFDQAVAEFTEALRLDPGLTAAADNRKVALGLLSPARRD